MSVVFEDETKILEEENNCFGYVNGECTILKKVSLLSQDHLNCGTLRCPFYKPIDHADSIKHVDDDGDCSFETRKEYEERTGKTYLSIEAVPEYEYYPHADWGDVENCYKKYLPDPRLDKASKPDLVKKAVELGLDIPDGAMKSDILEMVAEKLRCLESDN